MSGWAWFSTIWFGTILMVYLFSFVSTAVRSKWGLSDQVRAQIREEVAGGIHDYRLFMRGDPDEDGDREDILPLKFDDIDDLSSKL